MNFKEELQKKTENAEYVIERFLPKEDGFAKNLKEAINYSMTAGGKRLRPILMKETYLMFGGKGTLVEPFMAGMEMIHTHSLIHDDLPALDDDDYRRGKKTTHTVYGEAGAILAGDALLNYAYETMLLGAEDIENLNRTVQAMKVIADKTGMNGMLGGQSVDVENDGKPITQSMLDYIYENKTSALIEASMMTGAILAGADQEKVALIEKIGSFVGIAFQIQDDILDITSTKEELGKPVGSDDKNHKTTYVTLLGLEQAKKEVNRLSKEALSLLESLDEKNEFLYELIEKLIHRRK